MKNLNLRSHEGRIWYWDNLKAVLIFFVVLGHFLLPIMDRGNSVVSIVYYIYLFHMPAFVFVSGVFSKKYMEKGAPQLNKLIGYFIIYVLYKAAVYLLFSHYTGQNFNFDLLSEGSAPWYMLAMIIWLLILPVFAKLNFTKGIILALFIGIIFPFDDNIGIFLSMSRVVTFLPFFVFGYYFKLEYIKKLDKLIFKIFALLFLVFIALFVITNLNFISRYSSLLYAFSSYVALHTTVWNTLLLKIGWYLMSTFMLFALLILCPKRKFCFSYIGSRTLSIYIFHRLIREVFEGEYLYQYFDSSSFQLLGGCLIISLVIMLIFSEKHFSQFVNLPFKFTKK